jgi:hypothetical protein
MEASELNALIPTALCACVFLKRNAMKGLCAGYPFFNYTAA